MNKITSTHKLFFGAILILAVVMGAYAYLYKHIESLQGQLFLLRGEAHELETLAMNIQATETLLKDTEKERTELSRYFVSAEDPTEFLELIESSGKDAGVDVGVESIGVKEGEEKKDNNAGFKHLTISLSAQGGWEEMYHFLFLLEHLPFVAQITQATVTVAKNSEDGLWKSIILLECEAM